MQLWLCSPLAERWEVGSSRAAAGRDGAMCGGWGYESSPGQQEAGAGRHPAWPGVSPGGGGREGLQHAYREEEDAAEHHGQCSPVGSRTSDLIKTYSKYSGSVFRKKKENALTVQIICVVHPGAWAAAGRGGSSQTEASDGKGHHGCQDQEDRGGSHVAGRPEQQAQQGLMQCSFSPEVKVHLPPGRVTSYLLVFFFVCFF